MASSTSDGNRHRRKRPRRVSIATEPAPTRLALTVPEVAWLLNCSPNKVWSLVAREDLKSFRVGRKRLLARSEVERFIEAGGAVGEAV
jgi:excisionase family DNA binding protein